MTRATLEALLLPPAQLALDEATGAWLMHPKLVRGRDERRAPPRRTLRLAADTDRRLQRTHSRAAPSAKTAAP